MGKRKGKPQPTAKPVRDPKPKRAVEPQARTFVRGQKGEALPGTKTAFRRARRADPGLTRKAFLCLS